MAFPSSGGTNTTNAALTSPFSLNLPTGIKAGDVLLMFLTRNGGTQTFTWPAGWTQLYSLNTPAAVDRVACAWRFANGSEGTTISVSSTVATSQQTTAFSYRVIDGSAAVGQAGTTGNSTSPDPPAITPSFGSNEYLWFAHWGGNAAVTTNTWPTNYSLNNLSVNAAGGSSAVGARQLNASTDNPGTYALSGASTWATGSVAVYPIVNKVGRTNPKVFRPNFGPTKGLKSPKAYPPSAPNPDDKYRQLGRTPPRLFRPRQGPRKGFSGPKRGTENTIDAVDDTVFVTGVSAAGLCGIADISDIVIVNLVGVNGTGSIGSQTGVVLKTVTGVFAGGVIGTVVKVVLKGVTGVSGTGIVNAITPNPKGTPSGVNGTGAAGTVDKTNTKGLTGVNGTNQAGTVTGSISEGINGVSGSGSTGSSSFALYKFVVGVSANGLIGQVTLTGVDPPVGGSSSWLPWGRRKRTRSRSGI